MQSFVFCYVSMSDFRFRFVAINNFYQNHYGYRILILQKLHFEHWIWIKFRILSKF